MEQLSRELEGVRQDIKEQQQELKAAVEAKKPEPVIATIREEKTRLVARQQRLEDQLGALQAQQAGPAGAFSLPAACCGDSSAWTTTRCG